MTAHGYNEYINWFKSIKDRVQPQPKQEWSEEEIEKAAQEWDSKANFKPFCMTPTGVKQDITTHKESFKAGINWILKSLRHQNHWKPSDEQMKILNEVLNFAANHESSHWNDYIFGTLNNLIRQLKKLREE